MSLLWWLLSVWSLGPKVYLVVLKGIYISCMGERGFPQPSWTWKWSMGPQMPSQPSCDQQGNWSWHAVQIGIGRGERWKEPQILMELPRCIRHLGPALPVTCTCVRKYISLLGEWAWVQIFCYLTPRASKPIQGSNRFGWIFGSPVPESTQVVWGTQP